MLPRIIRPDVSSISACPSVRGFDDEIEVRPIVGAKRPTTAGHPARADENVPCTARPSPVACRRRPLEGWASPATGWLIVLRQAFNADKARGTASVVAPSLPRRLCGRHPSQGTCRQPPQSLYWRPSCTPDTARDLESQRQRSHRRPSSFPGLRVVILRQSSGVIPVDGTADLDWECRSDGWLDYE